MAANDLVVGIGGDARGFRKAVTGVEGGLTGLSKTTRSVTGVMKTSFLGLAAALGPLFAAVKVFQLFSEGSKAALVQQKAEQKLAAVIKATGNAAGVTAEEIQKLASARQAVTDFGDEATIDASGILATFKEIRGDRFREAIPLMQDMSAVMGQDLKSSAVQMGKALNDPIAGVGALSRVGVQFTTQQKEMIKSLAETGQMTKAQNVIFEELKSQFGGAAEAMSDPLTRANNAWGDFKEQLGFIFNDIKIAVLEAFGFDDAMAGTQNLADTFRTQFLPTIKSVLGVVSKLWKGATSLFSSLWNGFIGSTIKEILFVDENWDTFLLIAWERVKLFASNSVERFKTFFTNVGELMSWLGDNWPALLTDMTNFTVTAAKNMAANVGEFFKSVLDFAKGKGFKPEFKSLTDGFESSLKELPKLTKANVKESTAELDRLTAEAAAARLEFDKRFNVGTNLKPEAPGLGPTDPGTGGVTRDDFKPLESTAVGSKEAFEKIFAATGGVKQSRPEDETAENTKEMAVVLGDLKRLWERVEKKLGPEKALEFLG